MNHNSLHPETRLWASLIHKKLTKLHETHTWITSIIYDCIHFAILYSYDFSVWIVVELKWNWTQMYLYCIWRTRPNERKLSKNHKMWRRKMGAKSTWKSFWKWKLSLECLTERPLALFFLYDVGKTFKITQKIVSHFDLCVCFFLYLYDQTRQPLQSLWVQYKFHLFFVVFIHFYTLYYMNNES